VAGLLVRWTSFPFDFFSARHSTMRALGCARQLRRNDMAVITGDANDNVLRGLSGADSIYGLDGDDTLYGPGKLFGGKGDDTYIYTQTKTPMVNYNGSYGTELPDQGYDTLIINMINDGGVVFTDNANIEEFVINGNPGAVGGLGGPGDTLQPLVIHLNATHTALDEGTGLPVDELTGEPVKYYIWSAAGDDTIWGSAFGDHIDGSKGADVMLGGKGDDIYEVDVKSDIVIEMGGGGHDRINCTAREYNLQINVEDLYAYGEKGATGKHFNGNVGSNHIEITGDFNRDVLAGKGNDYVSTAGGNDWLRGGEGNDTLVGGLGNDYYRNEGTNFGADVINDAGGTNDTLEFLGVDAERLWFTQIGNDLKITNIDSPNNSVRVQNWFTQTDPALETIFAHGKELDGRLVSELVSVMSDFVMPINATEPMNAVVAQFIQADWH
jgi:Ca2+-binding RTX toxin-like protein